MSAPTRRALMRLAAGLAGVPLAHGQPAGSQRPGRQPLRFPADHGAHPQTRTEWWYATGWLHAAGGPDDAPAFGFQVTFFRSRTGLSTQPDSAFTARQLLMAHAAVTDLRAGTQLHDQRLARAGPGWADAAEGDAHLRLRDWSLRRGGPADDAPWQAHVASPRAGFALALQLQPTQPLLLQGQAGWSRKGPQPAQVSRYVTLPQLAVSGRVVRGGEAVAMTGRAWLDHEWSDEILPTQASGWDWIGINLDDGSALTAFRLRRPDGTALWAGGSWRAPGAAVRDFTPAAVTFTPRRRWVSPATGATYPVEWSVATPAGTWTVRSLLDAQELDARASTGTVYWEGLAELRDAAGHRVGRGYLEMTGYVGRLQL